MDRDWVRILGLEGGGWRVVFERSPPSTPQLSLNGCFHKTPALASSVVSVIYPAGCCRTEPGREALWSDGLQACRCWFYSLPGLKGGACMTAWMIKSHSESVWPGRDEHHYQRSSCQTWHSLGQLSFIKPDHSGFTESLIWFNQELEWEQVPFGAGRRGDASLSWFWQQILSDTPTEMSQDLVIKALSRVLQWLQQSL